ncbi:MAG: acyl-CoA dehydrogenase family protein [Nitrospiraceae bacterium]
MISFEIPEEIEQTVNMIEAVATEMMRPKARYFDDHEHEVPWDYINFMHDALQAAGGMTMAPKPSDGSDKPRLDYQQMAHSGLGAAAVSAAGTPEQKKKFLKRFANDNAVFSAMAITEPHAGSDTAAIKTTAVRDGEDWILNGEKIFVTGGHKSLVDTPGFVVVWATIDPEAGRNLSSWKLEHQDAL